MEQTTPTLFANIPEIQAASGLYFHCGNLYIISDNTLVLYIFNIKTKTLETISLNPEQSQIIALPKKVKPDFESITFSEEKLFLFSSGSTKKRTQLKVIDIASKEISNHSLEKLYSKMRTTTAILNEDFNIEGVILEKDTAYFFNRNNGPNQNSGIIKVDNWKNHDTASIAYFPISLPIINGVPFGFTDACWVDGSIFFSASAEASNSTYDDGEVLGSGIGKISFPELKLLDFKIISNNLKIEGLSLLQKHNNKLEFLFCTDADNEQSECPIYNWFWNI
ncbi:MAG TPA: hypothetical protein PKX92_00620 [Edaphocola sp.]|nr:hypothetical protein [Edaphocola sp.]